ncbi:MAG: type II toxin-antitoxin system RelE/ParE family toxin [Bacillota bacterium]
MDRRIVWSREAAADLEALARYIAKDSLFYAAAVVQEILDASRSLRRFAERGRIVPELGDRKFRELLIRGYRLIYRLEESQVLIVGLVHGKRNLKRLWRRGKRNG